MSSILLLFLLSVESVYSFYRHQCNPHQIKFVRSTFAINGGQRADHLIQDIIPVLYSVDSNGVFSGVEKLLSVCSKDIVWDDTADRQLTIGVNDVRKKLSTRVSKASKKKAFVVLDRIADGCNSSGFTWHLKVPNVSGIGLRGTTFLSLNSDGEIDYVREVVEPLYKPGSAIVGLLKSVAAKGMEGKPLPAPVVYERQDPATAPDLVKYLWYKVQGSDKAEFFRLVDDNIFYEDFNYKVPFIGKAAVGDFIEEFNFPGITFVPGRISDGVNSCCFTFEVAIAGVAATTKGVSFYERDVRTGKLCYIRDIPESAIKPPPLQSIASFLRPGLRRFKPILG